MMPRLRLVAMLRTAALTVGYILPMLLIFAPVQIPARFLWSGIAEHRGLADTVLCMLCPALVWLAQHAFGPTDEGPRGQILGVPLSELLEATLHFDETTKLGSGSSGEVFGARIGQLRSLPREGRFAVKRLRHSARPATTASLHREIQLLGKCRHENLLPLVGYCIDQRAMCLVYPLCIGGNLDDRISRSPSALRRLDRLSAPRSASPGHRDAAQQHHEWAPLSFLERLRIIRDATRALIYLHEASPGGGKGVVLHRDVKPTNILLDAHLNAKLADVDLATEATAIDAGNSHVSTRGGLVRVSPMPPPCPTCTAPWSCHLTLCARAWAWAGRHTGLHRPALRDERPLLSADRRLRDGCHSARVPAQQAGDRGARARRADARGPGPCGQLGRAR